MSEAWVRRALAALAAVALVPLAWNEWSRLADERRRAALVNEHREAGEQALADGDAARAVIALQRARDLAPVDDEVQDGLLRAQAHLVARRPEVLTPQTAPVLAHELSLALRRGPARPAIYHVATGNIAAWQGDAAAAEAAYRKAIEADDGLPEAHHALGRLLLGQGRAPDAEPALRRAVELAGPQATTERVALGRALLAQGKNTHAAEALQQAAELDRSYTTLHALGRAELARESWERAITAFEGALKAIPPGETVPDASLHEDLGYACFRAGRLPAALEQLTLAVQRGAGVQAVYNLGVVQQAMGDLPNAARTFERVVTHDPTLADAHLRLLGALVQDNRLATALEAAQRYLKLADQLPALQAERPKVEQLLARLQKDRPPQPGEADR